MEWVTEPERKTKVVADVDVLVCGGGIAGVSAAFTVAKFGMKVMLLEKYGFLGGMVTAGLVITTPPLDNGINAELSRRLKEQAVYVECRNSGEDTEFLNMRAVDPEIVKYELARMLIEKKASILFHTYVVDVIVENGKLRGVIIENKGGRQAILARLVVDATGDADVASLAGAPFRLVKKPMTLMYNMIGVDYGRVLKQIQNWSNLKKIVREGIDKGQLPFELGIYPEFGAPGVHAEQLVYDGELNVWSGMLLGMNGIDPNDLTHAELTTREHVMRLTKFLKKTLPGFEKSRIEYTATQVGVRATRQINGSACPTMDEVKGTVFSDTVVKPYTRSTMRLPYGSILPEKVENLIVAGRCISAAEEAMGQLRLIPVCSATGQAAGAAAALALEEHVPPRRVDVRKLQERLIADGMDLGL